MASESAIDWGSLALDYQPNRYVHPVRIRDLELRNNLTLAPMAGFTNLAFRLIAKEVGGCGLVASEMVAALAPGARTNDKRFQFLTESVPDEKPIAMQIYGRDPGLCAATAQELEAQGADIIDLNCGCPVKKAKQAACGVALMKEPAQVGRIVAAIRAVTDKPVAVKMRLGFDAENRTMLEVAQAAIDNGADMLAVHARTGESKHGTAVDLSGLAEVKQLAGAMPVLANGSMDTAEAIRNAKDIAGADGYQIGRSACGDPWLFRNLIAELTGGEVHEPSLAERRALLERHYELIIRLFGEQRGTMIMRKYTFFYCQGLPGVRAFRAAFVKIKDRQDFDRVVGEFFGQLEDPTL
ncbi:MAG: tRNA-dihydrouridine synthase [Planctomycetota bacterium]|jgi:tRNA-dihydrouridine synthase B|nr:tRNA-dihydrouridine synthase [Planctomycetota bacterium]